MESSYKSFIRILSIVGCLILLYLMVLFVASVVQLAEAADRLYLGLGQPVFFTIIIFFGILLVSPFYLYFKLPKALVPPLEVDGPIHEAYIVKLKQRLKSNKLLKDRLLSTNDDVVSALKILSLEADKTIHETAGVVFMGTAIMQNGRLDGLITLATQAQMVWSIAETFYQRPSPRQMIYLYSNVAANALLAESIEDLDFSEITAPILASAIGTIPGASLMANSVANGAANAFLTLRVGCIAKQYCEAISTPNKSLVRRNATLAAAAMVGGIVKENTAKILSGSWKLVTKGVVGTIDSSVQGVKSVAGIMTNTVSQGTQSVGNAMGSVIDSTKKMARKITSGQEK
jgi:hypothetical protein